MSVQEIKQPLDYEKVKQEKVQFLQSHELMVLATSYGDRVTARTVHYVSDGLDIYFMSWEHHNKCVQIKGNPKVAICIDTLQIEGTATILGSPLDEKNREYADIFKARIPGLFDSFAPRPGMVMVKVTTTFIVTWGRDGDKRYLEHLDLHNKRAYIFEEFLPVESKKG